MNSLHHGVLPATEGREKQMFHAPFAADNISLGLSALQTTLWNMCPADVQLIVRSANRSTRNITPLAKPLKALSQHLPKQIQGTLTAKEVAVPSSAGLTWAMGWSAVALQIQIQGSQIQIQDSHMAAGGISWGHRLEINRSNIARCPVGEDFSIWMLLTAFWNLGKDSVMASSWRMEEGSTAGCPNHGHGSTAEEAAAIAITLVETVWWSKSRKQRPLCISVLCFNMIWRKQKSKVQEKMFSNLKRIWRFYKTIVANIS